MTRSMLFASCLAVAGVLPAVALADHHAAEADVSGDTRTATQAEEAMSAADGGLQEVEAASRASAAPGTESIRGTGLQHVAPDADAGDGTESIRGTGVQRTEPEGAEGDATESIRGTGLTGDAADTESIRGTGLTGETPDTETAEAAATMDAAGAEAAPVIDESRDD